MRRALAVPPLLCGLFLLDVAVVQAGGRSSAAHRSRQRPRRAVERARRERAGGRPRTLRGGNHNQIVVVTLESLQGLPIEDYGYQLGRHWGIGQKGKDNGALLIVAPEEREVRIEVGYGPEGELTDAQSRTIIETRILPRFRRGDFAAGIKAGPRR